MASIRKRNNRWEVRVRHCGVPTQSKTFTLKSKAVQWARETEIAVEKGEILKKPKVSPITLEGAVKRYIDEVAIYHKGLASERYRLWGMVHRLGSNSTLSQITSKDVANYKVERQKKVTSASVRRELNLLSSLFETAKNEWGLAALKNPVTTIKRPPDSIARKLQNQHL